MRTLAVLLLMILAGCASQQDSVPSQRRVVPAEQVKSELLRLTDEHWRAFGSQVVRHDLGRVAIEPVGRYFEDDRAVFERMVAYWNAVGEGRFSSYEDCQGSWQRVPARKCPWHLPWSASFISWLMLQSGVAEFQPDASHANYLQPIFAATVGAKPSYLVAHDIAQRAPRPGDLVCSTRGLGAQTPGEWRELVGRLVPMHCDVVVANSGERIELIGGNVYNTVSKSIFAARNGYLDRSAGRAFIVVIENRYPTPSS